jgi:hypothetical protein
MSLLLLLLRQSLHLSKLLLHLRESGLVEPLRLLSKWIRRGWRWRILHGGVAEAVELLEGKCACSG